MCCRLFPRSLPRNNMVPGTKKNNGVTAELPLLCCETGLEDPRGKSVNISAKTVSELVRAKSSEIDTVK